jgi:hypothetical protein
MFRSVCVAAIGAAVSFTSIPLFAAEPAPAGDTRYFGGLLDSRSIYGQFWFPEPLRGPEMDVDRETRLDWFHAEGDGAASNTLNAEIEYNFGNLTVEVEVPYENTRELTLDEATGMRSRDRSEGIGPVEIAARHPIFQCVSRDNFFDYSLVGALEIAIPTNTEVGGKDFEFVPKLFQLLRLGDHFSVQSSVGLSMLAGPEEGGNNVLEYSLILGYNIDKDQLRIPGVSRIIPILELNGETGLNRQEKGNTSLSGTVGGRVNLKPIGIAQPRFGFGYVFPLNDTARAEFDWGLVTSILFEF